MDGRGRLSGSESCLIFLPLAAKLTGVTHLANLLK